MISKITVVAVGKVKERYISEGISEFLKRLKPFCRIEVIELKDQGLKKESEKIEKYISNSSYILDSKGKEFSSEEFAELLKKQEGELTLIIGGPEGIEQNTKSKSKLLSLSKMTFTHEMSRLFLIEQIYRACMINSGRGYYHK
jgi:23S rRNA (pseudouridine1915-N3)-methyltransferase